MKKENIYVSLSTQKELDTLLNVLISHGEKVGGIRIDSEKEIWIGFEDGAWWCLNDTEGRVRVDEYMQLVKILKKPSYTAAEIANLVTGIAVVLIGIAINQPTLLPIGFIQVCFSEIIRQVRLK